MISEQTMTAENKFCVGVPCYIRSRWTFETLRIELQTVVSQDEARKGVVQVSISCIWRTDVSDLLNSADTSLHMTVANGSSHLVAKTLTFSFCESGNLFTSWLPAKEDPIPWMCAIWGYYALKMVLFFWVMKLCRLRGRYRRFGEKYCLHLQDWSGGAGNWELKLGLQGQGKDRLPFLQTLVSTHESVYTAS
jgi:hypothetical protein